MTPYLAFLGAGFSGGEILVVFIAILMLFGAKNVPNIARTIGKSFEEFRKASRSVTDEIMRADVKDEPAPRKAEMTEGTCEEEVPEPRAAEQSVGRSDGKPPA